jgi:hypothetical protein
MSKNTIIDGIAASEHIDSSGESLSIEGMDISSLGGSDSILNWEHGSKDRPGQVVGKVTFARKIMKKEDAKSQRELYFWNKAKKPFVYIKAELFDGLGHSGAEDVAAMLKYKNKDKGEDSRLVVGFSIEGGKIEKHGMLVTKSIARDVAITVKPCNKICDAEVIESDIADDFLYKNQNFDCEILESELSINSTSFRSILLQNIKKSEWKPSKEDQEQIKELKITPKAKEKIEEYDTDNNMRKALIASMIGGSPDSRTGIAALTSEHLEGKLEKPFRSKAQRKFAYANPEKFGGKEGVKEWEEKTPKKLPEKIKKSEELKKMSQPHMQSKELGLGQNPRMDVKIIDPEKKYKTSSVDKPEISSTELENKKLTQMAQQGMRQQQKNPQKISPKKQEEIQTESQKSYGKKLDPEKHSGINLNIPGYGQKSFAFQSKKQNEGADFARGASRYGLKESKQAGPEIHEATHGFFTDIENKYSPQHATALSQRLLKENFHPKDLEKIKSWVKERGYKVKNPYFNEEHITHISDILNTPASRKDFYQHMGFKNPEKIFKKIPEYVKALKTGKGMEKFSPEELQNIRQVRHIDKRLKRGWKNATQFVNNPLQLSDFFNQINEKQKKSKK